MDDSCIISIAQIKEFLKLNGDIHFKAVSKKEKYQWIENALIKFRYLD